MRYVIWVRRGEWYMEGPFATYGEAASEAEAWALEYGEWNVKVERFNGRFPCSQNAKPASSG